MLIQETPSISLPIPAILRMSVPPSLRLASGDLTASVTQYPRRRRPHPRRKEHDDAHDQRCLYERPSAYAPLTQAAAAASAQQQQISDERVVTEGGGERV